MTRKTCQHENNKAFYHCALCQDIDRIYCEEIGRYLCALCFDQLNILKEGNE